MLQDLYAFQERKIRIENGEEPSGADKEEEEEPHTEQEVKPMEAGDSANKL
ncbi:MAG: hypothetical protein MJ252_02855 [archaeon]|nr:hypothetical protein [archaeon]